MLATVMDISESRGSLTSLWVHIHHYSNAPALTRVLGVTSKVGEHLGLFKQSSISLWLLPENTEEAPSLPPTATVEAKSI